MSLVARETEVDQLASAIDQLMRREVRDSLAARCRQLPPLDGARMAARLIAAGAATGAAVAPPPEPVKGARHAAPPAPAPIRSRAHPIEIIRLTRRRVRKTRNALRPHAGVALRAVRMRAAEVLPWSWVPPSPLPLVASPGAPVSRVLLVADRDFTAQAAVEELVDWASAQRGGAVILARPGAVQPLRRAGLAVELMTDLGGEEVGERIGFSTYWNEKARLLLQTYDCGPVIFWGDSELRRHWPVLLLLDR